MAGGSGGAARHVSLTLAAGANAPAIERGDVHAPEMKRTTSQLARHAASEHDERVPLRPSAAQATEMKEIRLGRSVKIDPHDVQVRIDQSRRFLMHGHKVMVTQKFKGREIAHKEIGLSNLRDVADALADVAKVEQTPRWMGKQASIILSPDKVKVEAVKRRLEKEKAEKIAAGQKVEEEKSLEQLEQELEVQNQREGPDDEE